MTDTRTVVLYNYIWLTHGLWYCTTTYDWCTDCGIVQLHMTDTRTVVVYNYNIWLMHGLCRCITTTSDWCTDCGTVQHLTSAGTEVVCNYNKWLVHGLWVIKKCMSRRTTGSSTLRPMSVVNPHSEHRFPAPKEGCRKPVLGVCCKPRVTDS